MAKTVLYQCECAGSVYSPTTKHFPLSHLYFCTSDKCQGKLKCSRCTIEEVASFYCPNCLFEAPSASVKSERNRCARNCFECPTCLNTLTVVSTMENPLGGDSTPAPSGGIHYLSCGVCRWDSLEIGLKFDRPTGLAMQMQKTDDERADIQEFSNLKTHFEKKTRTVTAPSNGSMADLFRSSSISLPPSLLANIPALASLSSFSGSKGNLDPDANAVYEAKFTGSEANDTAQLEKMKNLVIEEATTLGQRYQQIEDQPRTHAGVRPQRLLLRTKRTKLCKDCDHVLIKPEQKAQVSKFTIQLPAIDFVPRITIAHPLPTALPLEPGTTYTVHLKVVNPQTNPIDLMFGTVDDTTIDFPASVVTILAPAFKLEALNELEMYDDDKIGHAAPKEAGIVEKKNNWAVFAVEVTVLRIISSTFEFPILMKYTRSGDETGGEPVSLWVVVAI